MKIITLVVSFCLLVFITQAQFTSGQWNLVSGEQIVPWQPFYGQKGLESSARPQSRLAQAGWKDKSGNVWIYGGKSIFNNGGYWASDLWKLSSQTNRWTWVGGDSVERHFPVFGTLGNGNAQTTPGYRVTAATWTDSTGNLWLFGGNGDVYEAPYSNDLWRYDPSANIWTWMKGDSTREWFSVYGTKKVPSNNNKPGSRGDCMTWTDKQGNLWLMGGTQYNFDTRYSERMNDLWKYNVATNQWVWISGAKTGDHPGVYGTKGTADTANFPKARAGATTWTDANGNFWMFGGSTARVDLINDLWKFDPVAESWTWMGGSKEDPYIQNYGAVGVPAASNYPGGRSEGMGWTDLNGDLWLYDGETILFGSQVEIKNDLWRYNVASGLWTWMGGSQTGTTVVYGKKNLPAATNQPGRRTRAFAWTDSLGNLLFFAGTIDALGNTNRSSDMWKYQPGTGTWTWIGGEKLYTAPAPVYAAKGVLSSEAQPKDFNGYAWKESNGNLALLQSPVVWNFDPVKAQWMWRDGDTSGTINYGTKGVSAASNSPGARSPANGWTDRNNDLWIFGGRDPYQSNDLWQFSVTSRQWTWISGSSGQGAIGTYGNKGMSGPDNSPGARKPAANWLDSSGNYWLFGGAVTQTTTPRYNTAYFNDLWKFDIGTREWTWIAGLRTPGGTAVKGTQGVSSPTTTPGAELAVSSWTDKNGDLWLQTVSSTPELWKFTIATGEWTWVRNERPPVIPPRYGTHGQMSGLNNPGTTGRDIVGLSDKHHKWFYGGLNNTTYYNHIWQNDVDTEEWAWMGGDSIPNVKPGSIIDGATGSELRPGARLPDIAFFDNDRNLWLFGGPGVQVNGVGKLNDIWKFTTAGALPLQFGTITVGSLNKSNLVQWTTLQEENNRYFVIERSANGTVFLAIGQVEGAGQSVTTRSYQFTDETPLNGVNFYRVKQVDKDGASTYSKIVSISFREADNSFRLVKNPVDAELIVESRLKAGAPMHFQLRDLTGRLILSSTRTAGASIQQHMINVSNLHAGQYLLTIRSGGNSITKNFMKK